MPLGVTGKDHKLNTGMLELTGSLTDELGVRDEVIKYLQTPYRPTPVCQILIHFQL